MFRQTIVYYFTMGLEKFKELFGKGESTEENSVISGSTIPSVSSGELPSTEIPAGLPGATNAPGGFEGALDTLAELAPTRKEVFNVSRNIYTYGDAAAVCKAFGADLATFEQMKKAHENGADWCNYGWIQGQMAVFTTQKSTYEKLQKGSPEQRMACGMPGVNGGFWDNPDLRFGVNCYGVKPSKKATDELGAASVQFPPSAEEIEFDRKVQRFRDQIDTITVLPWNRQIWTTDP